MAKVLILGGGFAAVSAAEELMKDNDGSIQVTVISASREFIFYPALVPFVFGGFDKESIHFDLAEKLRLNGIRLSKARCSRSIRSKRPLELPAAMLRAWSIMIGC